jgi:hypothetical protein
MQSRRLAGIAFAVVFMVELCLLLLLFPFLLMLLVVLFLVVHRLAQLKSCQSPYVSLPRKSALRSVLNTIDACRQRCGPVVPKRNDVDCRAMLRGGVQERGWKRQHSGA